MTAALLKDYGLVLVSAQPNSVTANFKKHIYRSNKATLFYNLDSVFSPAYDLEFPKDHLVIVLLDHSSSEEAKNSSTSISYQRSITDHVVSCLALSPSTNFTKLSELPTVYSDWLDDSLQNKKIEDIEKYKLSWLDWENYRFGSGGGEHDVERSLIPRRSRMKSKSPVPHTPEREASYRKEEGVDDSMESPMKKRKVVVDSEAEAGVIEANKRIIDILTQMSEEYLSESKNGLIGFKAVAYRKAITAIRNANKPILTYDDAIKLPNVGHKIALKIEEIAQTGNLHQLDAFLNDEHHRILKLFSSVSGVGSKLANEWYDKGYRSIDDVIEKESSKLSTVLKNGLLFHNDWTQRIPREEVSLHYKFIKNVASTQVNADLQVQVLGSYARGKPDCGDIDLIIYSKDENNTQRLQKQLHHLVVELTEVGYVKCDIVSVHSKMSKFMGGVILPDNKHNVCRRLDIIYARYSELGACRLYFIGNDMFNRGLRLLAGDQGMKLSQHGLFRKRFNTNDDINDDGEDEDTVKDEDMRFLVESFSEEKIMQHLGVDWRRYKDYKDRNIESVAVIYHGKEKIKKDRQVKGHSKKKSG